MKKLYLLFVPLLALLGGCTGDDGPRKDVIWDIPYPSISFAVLDSDGNNIFKENPDAIYDFEIEYKGETYRYNDQTRELPQLPLALTTDGVYPYRLTFGDFGQDDSGSYIVRFRDKEWLVEFEYELTWKKHKPVKRALIKIDGKVVNPEVVDTLSIDATGERRDVYATPLYYEEGEMEWDIVFPTATFAVVDDAGNNIFKSKPESIYEFAITYNGETYRYNDQTRELPQLPLAITTDGVYPYRLTFGDFDYNESGSYTIDFDGQQWLVDFEYKLRWEGGRPTIREKVMINGNAVEPKKIDSVEVNGTLQDVYALPLYKSSTEWDIRYPTAMYVVVDDEGNNIFKSEPESMYEFEIIYNEESYKYHDETRELPKLPLAITRGPMYPYRLTFGDFEHNEKGSYLIKFRDSEWLVEFEYALEWVDEEPVLSESLKIDGVEAKPEFIEEWFVDDYHGNVKMFAIPLSVK